MKAAFGTSRRLFGPVFASPIKQKKIDEIVRVDHAGEVAAVRIAANQLFWMSPLDESVPIVNEILEDEIVHRRVMNELADQHGVRKTALDPLFKLGALAMGVGTAALGKEAMMCCHAAVEVTIYDHYNDQLREMETLESATAEIPESAQEKDAWTDVKDYIVKFRDEEKHHQELGEQNGADQAPAYPLLYNGIRLACKLFNLIAHLVTGKQFLMSISASACEKLEGFSKRLDEICDQRDDASNKLRFEYRQKMQPLFEERAAALASAENYWSGVLLSPMTPVSEFMNNTVDPKIVRAITNVKVTYTMNGSKLQRKVEVTLRPSMFAEEGVVSREVDAEGKTVSVQPIKWKAGTDRARTDSLFRFFEEKTDLDELTLSDITDAFDIIFQDPFIADINE